MTDPNLISIRECARRLGVSDTAVHKARKEADAGKPARVVMDVGGKLVLWEDTKAAWLARSDVTRRSHVGPQGSPRRAGEKPQVALTTSDRMDEAPSVSPPAGRLPPQANASGDDDEDGPASGRGSRYAKARAEKEFYNAELARIEYENKVGRLIDAEEVKLSWAKHITAAKTRIMGIPAACKSRCSDLPLDVVATVERVCREALEDLAGEKPE